jgi:hemolysin activation/secretion protein
MGAGGTASAQVPSSPPSPLHAVEEGLRRQEERARETAPPPAHDVLQRPQRVAPPAPGLPVETRCFVVERMVFTGPDAAGFGWMRNEIAPYLGRCLGASGLSQLVAALDARLIAEGYATSRVSLPEQNLASGELRLHLDVGRIESVVLRDPRHPDGERRTGAWRLALPFSPGDILNIRDVEQGVEQMRRLPSQPTDIRLEPGSVADTSRVVVERTDAGLSQRARGGFTLDNAGPSSLGRWQASGNLTVENPLGLGDVLGTSFSTNLQRPTGTHRGQSLAGYYSLPWGYDLLTFNASHSRFAQYVQGTTVRFLSSGSSDTLEARWQHVAWRSASAKAAVHAAVSTRAARSYLDDVEVVVQRRRTTMVDVGASAKKLWEQAALDAEINLRQGVPWAGAQDDLSTAQSGGPTLRPRIFSASATVSASLPASALLPAGLQYSGTLRGQTTRDETLATDQFAIGGRMSVRGFSGETVLLAESGLVWRNEIAGPLAPRWGLQTQWYAALDGGRVHGPGAAFLRGRQLTGTALGVRGRGGDIVADASLGMPLSHPAGFHASSPVLTLSLSWLF